MAVLFKFFNVNDKIYHSFQRNDLKMEAGDFAEMSTVTAIQTL
jgi:hypothetical protein